MLHRHGAIVLMTAVLSSCGGSVVETAPSSHDAGSEGGSDAGIDSEAGGVDATMSCDEIVGQFEIAIERARICQPQISKPQCTASVVSGLSCGCPTFVNADNVTEIENMKSLQSAWATQLCGDDSLCGACPPAPTAAYCEVTPPGSSVSGLCVDAT
jgi:hypothetical protein